MRKIRLTLERAIFAQGYGSVAGVDEVGRGAWAGPLVAAALRVEPRELVACRRLAAWVRDSKTLTARQRERGYAAISPQLCWAVGVVAHHELDHAGLTAANQTAMDRAIAALTIPPDFILVDGQGWHFAWPHRQVIAGDQKIFCVAAASIIAKVTRDHLMAAFDHQYPAYGFGQHKGYGTREHQAALARHGPCPIHRRTFAPIAAFH